MQLPCIPAPVLSGVQGAFQTRLLQGQAGLPAAGVPRILNRRNVVAWTAVPCSQPEPLALSGSTCKGPLVDGGTALPWLLHLILNRLNQRYGLARHPRMPAMLCKSKFVKSPLYALIHRIAGGHCFHIEASPLPPNSQPHPKHTTVLPVKTLYTPIQKAVAPVTTHNIQEDNYLIQPRNRGVQAKRA